MPLDSSCHSSDRGGGFALARQQLRPDAGLKSILNAVVVICIVSWLLNVFGLFGSLAQIHVGR